MQNAHDHTAGTAAWPSRLELVDRTGEIDYEPVLNAFARDELLCRRTGASGEALLHLWRHPRAFVLGLRDSRLSAAGEAEQWLHRLGYSTAVRNSGGAAVPLDLGVLNVSLVLPKPKGALDYRDDFRLMARMLADCFSTGEEEAGGVRSGEIAGSYCPGEFDLSIGGRKFCGIAQRRHANAVVVQAFVVVDRTGAERAALARAFYEQAAAGQDGGYPHVRPETMGSLSELLGVSIEAEQAAAAIVAYAKERAVVAAPRREALPSDEALVRTAAELLARYARHR